MFVRKKRNKSGSISVPVIDTSGSRDKLIKTIGSSFGKVEIEELCKKGSGLYKLLLWPAADQFILSGRLGYFQDSDPGHTAYSNDLMTNY